MARLQPTGMAMDDDRKLDPSQHFKSPADVAAASDLSTQDKVDVLTNWANELRQQQVAEEENMPGQGATGDLLQAVEQTLLELGGHDRGHDAKA